MGGSGRPRRGRCRRKGAPRPSLVPAPSRRHPRSFTSQEQSLPDPISIQQQQWPSSPRLRSRWPRPALPPRPSLARPRARPSGELVDSPPRLPRPYSAHAPARAAPGAANLWIRAAGDWAPGREGPRIGASVALEEEREGEGQHTLASPFDRARLHVAARIAAIARMGRLSAVITACFRGREVLPRSSRLARSHNRSLLSPFFSLVLVPQKTPTHSSAAKAPQPAARGASVATRAAPVEVA